MDGEAIPTETSTGVITLLFKKGDPAEIANYRPITLLNSLYKTFTRILASRLKHVLPSIIGHTLAEWLRRQPAKLLGSARAGSNPAGVELFFAFLFCNS